MSKRKPGSNKRQPRTMDRSSKCISIMPDGSADYFTPKPRPKRQQLQRNADGSFSVVIKEKALL